MKVVNIDKENLHIFWATREMSIAIILSRLSYSLDSGKGFSKTSQRFHAWINSTKNIIKALDDGDIDRKVFVKLQKAFDDANHQILFESGCNSSGCNQLFAY